MSTTEEASLRAIHLPTEIDTWPLAMGWWILLGLLIALLSTGIWLWLRYRRQAFRREALRALDVIEQQIQLSPQQQSPQQLTPLQQIDALSALLKRVAMTVYGREAVAGRSGDQWLQFLDQTGQTRGFTQGPGRSLGMNRFQPQPTLDAQALILLCREWIQKQRC